MSKLHKLIKKHEGLVLHAYQDHLGFWTIGYGRLIDPKRGGGITEQEAEFLLENDLTRVRRELMRFDWFDDLDSVRQELMVAIAFQLGVKGLLNFKKTIRYIILGEYAEAAHEMLDSAWARQTPERAMEMSVMMRTGQYPS